MGVLGPSSPWRCSLGLGEAHPGSGLLWRAQLCPVHSPCYLLTSQLAAEQAPGSAPRRTHPKGSFQTESWLPESRDVSVVRPRLSLESREGIKCQLALSSVPGTKKNHSLEAAGPEVKCWPQNGVFSPSYLTTRQKIGGKNLMKRNSLGTDTVEGGKS